MKFYLKAHTGIHLHACIYWIKISYASLEAESFSFSFFLTHFSPPEPTPSVVSSQGSWRKLALGGSALTGIGACAHGTLLGPLRGTQQPLPLV